MPSRKQQELFEKLNKGFKDNENVNELLSKISERDFLEIFGTSSPYRKRTPYYASPHTLNYIRIVPYDQVLSLGTYESLNGSKKVEQVQAVLKRAKELGIPLGEIITYVLFSSEEKEQRYISLYECLSKDKFKFLPEVLQVIHETYGLEGLCRVSSVKNCNIIKGALEREMEKLEDGQKKSKYQGWLKEIEITKLKMKVEKVDRQVFAASVISGLAVELVGSCGYFAYVAAGGVLSPLALIGIVVAALLVTGLVASVTYAILKPSNELNEIDVQQKVSRESEVAA